MGFGSGRGNLGGNQAMHLLGDVADYFGGVFGKGIGFGKGGYGNGKGKGKTDFVQNYRKGKGKGKPGGEVTPTEYCFVKYKVKCAGCN